MLSLENLLWDASVFTAACHERSNTLFSYSCITPNKNKYNTEKLKLVSLFSINWMVIIVIIITFIFCAIKIQHDFVHIPLFSHINVLKQRPVK